MHLNDDHHWSREQIADFLEDSVAQKMDLSFDPPSEVTTPNWIKNLD